VQAAERVGTEGRLQVTIGQVGESSFPGRHPQVPTVRDFQLVNGRRVDGIIVPNPNVGGVG